MCLEQPEVGRMHRREPCIKFEGESKSTAVNDGEEGRRSHYSGCHLRTPEHEFAVAEAVVWVATMMMRIIARARERPTIL